MSDDTDSECNHEHDGRSIKIDTGFYEVQVWGDPDDDFEAVKAKAEAAADRARADVEALDERISEANGNYHS
jgi:hypothetical protein